MIFTEVHLYNPGILCAQMPDDAFQELKKAVNFQLENKSNNQKLKRQMYNDLSVQGIEEMMPIGVTPLYNKFLNDFALEFGKHFRLNIRQTESPKVVSSWLNLQKKYEYRPLHDHNDANGRNLSFVTYIHIPYTLKEEDTHPNHTNKATVHRNGRIEFVYAGTDGRRNTRIIDVDKTYEGKTLLFLNSFSHIVYPFYTSDDYRISLAGNINFI